MSILKLIRFQNLLMIAGMQVLVKYALLEPLGVETHLNNLGFTLLVLATVFIAAGGNILNDIYDVPIDLINKPQKVIVGKKISDKRANQLYLLCTTLGVLLGFLLSNLIEKPAFAAVFVIIAALLYGYASSFKGIIVLSNVLISFLVAMSILIIIIFDIVPVISQIASDLQIDGSQVILRYALFAFYLNLMREIVKDLQDIKGDRNGVINTLPIALGRSRTTYLVFALGIIGVVGIVYYMYQYLFESQIAVLYFLILVLAPLLFFCVKTWSAEKIEEYAFLSRLLKVVMFFGMCSLLLYPLVILK